MIEYTTPTYALTVSKYPLTLRSVFGTSHSLTTSRVNALISLTINGITGYGEIGLPPKKPHCYVADINDINDYFQAYIVLLKSYCEIPATYKICDFLYQNTSIKVNSIYPILQYLFFCLDTCPSNTKEYSRPAKCGMEGALFDIIGKTLHIPLHQVFNAHNSTPPIGFYTAAIHPTMEETLQSAQFGLKYTKAIKVKVSSDIPAAIATLKLLTEKQSLNKKSNYCFSIDANAAWTTQNAEEFLKQICTSELKSVKEMIYMVEQPFPVEISQIEKESNWDKIKKIYNEQGLLIFADESMSVANDVLLLAPYCNGVNIKLEKAGGFREAIKITSMCKQNSMLIWVGMMVGSILNSNMGAHLLPFASIGGDLDGALLVDDKSQLFKGGFEWSNKDGKSYLKLSDEPGIGLQLK